MCDREKEEKGGDNNDSSESESDGGGGDWSGKMYYPADFKEAARIVKMHKPYGPKSWPTKTNKSKKLTTNTSNNNDLTITTETEEDSISGVERIAKMIDPNSGAKPQFVYDTIPKTKLAMKKLQNLVPSNSFHNNINDREDKDYNYGGDSKRKQKHIVKTEELVKALARSVLEPRPIEWIKQNGVCLEHLVPKKSTIHDAGLGGFAQYGVAKDEIIVPTPVLQTVHKEILTLYERINKSNNYRHNIRDFIDNPEKYKVGTGLLYNYCFGHTDSSMLLCPLTSAMLINHCSVGRSKQFDCGHPDGPNAVVRWSSGWDNDSIQWRNATLDEIDNKFGRVLSLEIIATRDIQPNEEVFIDYGIDWENAWMKHVEEWKSIPLPNKENFISAQEANSRSGPIMKNLISNDLRENVVHPYLLIGCQYKIHRKIDFKNKNYTKPNKFWKTMTDQQILQTYGEDGSDYVYGDKSGYINHREYSHWPCSILKEEGAGTGRYTVQIHQSPLRSEKTRTTAWTENNVPRILTNYKQESIHYFIRPNSQDHMRPGVFRHHVGVPDNIYPNHWKNYI